MIHIIGKGNGEAVVFDEESPPDLRGAVPGEPNPGAQIADLVDAMIEDDDLRPAGSNAAPPRE